MKREECNDDKDGLKEASGVIVEEKIIWKGIFREYDIVLVQKNEYETFFMFLLVLFFLLFVFHMKFKN